MVANDPAYQGSMGFVNYVEGIYVGYKFYETAAQEGLINYDEYVQYPFGHGLSYTTFTQEITNFTENSDTVSMDVLVTNTGSAAGKEVVEVYFEPPYHNGGIEKASVNLVQFGKTQLLEAGDYTISLRADSHTVLDAATFTQDSDIDYSSGRPSDLIPAVNQFQDYSRGEFTQLSRRDGFANYEQAAAAPASLAMSAATRSAVEKNLFGIYDPASLDNPGDVMPTTGAQNGLKLIDLVGKDYDDPQWEQLLDQLTFEDMVTMINIGGWQTAAVSSVGKIATSDCDGPAMNTHRSAFAGRNFEYFSEDGVLAGYMASYEINGAATKGLYPYIKHFVLNDQETDRCAVLLTYASEQAIREIYLKPFERCVKGYTGKCLAAMSSFNFIGTEPSCSNPNLLNTVLRGEWGFVGMVESDYNGSYGYMISDHCVRTGNDLMLAFGSAESNKFTDRSATATLAMRQSCKNILYTIGNSGYYANGDPTGGMDNMTRTFLMADIGIGAVLVAAEALLLLSFRKRSKAAQ